MSGNGAPRGDLIANAIAKVEEPQAHRQWAVTISSTGRQAVVLLPADATDSEIAEFAGWLLTQVMVAYRAERAQSAASRIVVPRPGLILAK